MPLLKASILASCFAHAATTYGIPEPVLLSIAKVEGGKSGTVSRNENGTHDLGLMQINDTWLPSITDHYSSNNSDFARKSKEERRNIIRNALIYDDCYNISVGTWILKNSFLEADKKAAGFWTGVGYYHSHNPFYMVQYQHKVARAAVQLYGSTIIAGPVATSTADKSTRSRSAVDRSGKKGGASSAIVAIIHPMGPGADSSGVDSSGADSGPQRKITIMNRPDDTPVVVSHASKRPKDGGRAESWAFWPGLQVWRNAGAAPTPEAPPPTSEAPTGELLALANETAK